MPTVDLPDFWQSSVINIITQDLAEVVNRPKYGTATPAPFALPVTANVTTLLASVSGKGVIYGLDVYVQGADIQHDDYLSFDIDGVTFNTVTTEYAMLWNDILPSGALGWLGCYDETNYRYALHIGTGITFESLIKVSYKEAHGRTPTVFGVGFYALV